MPLWGQPRSVVVAFALGALCSLDLPLPLLSLARWGWTCCGSQNGRGLISCTVVRSAAIGYVYRSTNDSGENRCRLDKGITCSQNPRPLNTKSTHQEKPHSLSLGSFTPHNLMQLSKLFA
ncbi:hypothetical protein V8E52_011454 [Russula decolorans]